MDLSDDDMLGQQVEMAVKQNQAARMMYTVFEEKLCNGKEARLRDVVRLIFKDFDSVERIWTYREPLGVNTLGHPSVPIVIKLIFVGFKSY